MTTNQTTRAIALCALLWALILTGWTIYLSGRLTATEKEIAKVKTPLTVNVYVPKPEKQGLPGWDK